MSCPLRPETWTKIISALHKYPWVILKLAIDSSDFLSPWFNSTINTLIPSYSHCPSFLLLFGLSREIWYIELSNGCRMRFSPVLHIRFEAGMLFITGALSEVWSGGLGGSSTHQRHSSQIYGCPYGCPLQDHTLSVWQSKSRESHDRGSASKWSWQILWGDAFWTFQPPSSR